MRLKEQTRGWPRDGGAADCSQDQKGAPTMAERDFSEHLEERLRLEGESDAPPSAVGGVSGRPMKRRENPVETDERVAAEFPHEGGMGGTNRSPKLVEKIRKHRGAA
jgi:hypothetical protein